MKHANYGSSLKHSMVMPRLDEDGRIDLETSMRLAIPLSRLHRFVDWGVARSKLIAPPADIDCDIIGWRNSIPMRILPWCIAHDISSSSPSLLLTPEQNTGLPRVPIRIMDTRCNSLTDPLVPLWCRAVLDDNIMSEDVGHQQLFRVVDNALTWRIHSSFDDWDAANLVAVFDRFLERMVFLTPHSTVLDLKRKREGFQDWSDVDATIVRRMQCPMDLMVCILFLVKAVVPSVSDIPSVIVFSTELDPDHQAPIVVLDHNVLELV